MQRETVRAENAGGAEKSNFRRSVRIVVVRAGAPLPERHRQAAYEEPDDRTD
jgi:hypothetical protein